MTTAPAANRVDGASPLTIFASRQQIKTPGLALLGVELLMRFLYTQVDGTAYSGLGGDV